MKNNFCAVIACAWLAALMAGPAAHSAETPSAPVVPKVIEVPPGNSLALAATARGVQIYECRAKKDKPTEFEWSFKAPR